MKVIIEFLSRIMLYWIILIILFCCVTSYAQTSGENDSRDKAQKYSVELYPVKALSIYEIKHLLLKANPMINPNPAVEIDKKTVFLVLGAVSFAGFLASVLFFNTEIFSTMPLILLGVSVLCVFLGV